MGVFGWTKEKRQREETLFSGSLVLHVCKEFDAKNLFRHFVNILDKYLIKKKEVTVSSQ